MAVLQERCEIFVWVESFPHKIVSIAVNWYKAPAYVRLDVF